MDFLAHEVPPLFVKNFYPNVTIVRGPAIALSLRFNQELAKPVNVRPGPTRVRWRTYCNGADALHYSLLSQRQDLTDTKLAHPDDRTVYAGVILVHTNNSLHYFRISLGCVWIKI